MFVHPALALVTLLTAQPPAPTQLELKDGDRIIWIGNTLVEREQRYGYWETALHAAFPNRQFTLRNLGWSGDTVFGDARAGFDTPARGFERLVSLTLELKPTVIFVSYGTNESFEGEKGVPKFEKGLEKLLDALKPANARVILFSPGRVIEEEALAGNPDPKLRNGDLGLYGYAVQKVALTRGLLFVELNEVFRQTSVLHSPSTPAKYQSLTENGVHLTAVGYEVSAWSLLRHLGVQPPSFITPGIDRELSAKLDPLRKAIIEKNQLFFYRWRPQNETYLFGFRKHEQGKNAKEVAEFDPLVAKAEEEIERLRKSLK